MTTPVTGGHIRAPENPQPGIIGALIGGVRDAAVQVLNTLQNTSIHARARLYGLSREVPFDRWFYHHEVEKSLSDADISIKIQARVWALVALAESLVRGLAAVVQYCFAKVFGENTTVDESRNLLYAQWDSIRLSANAIISPEATVQAAMTADEGGQLPIGRLLSHGFTQGTPYP